MESNQVIIITPGPHKGGVTSTSCAKKKRFQIFFASVHSQIRSQGSLLPVPAERERGVGENPLSAPYQLHSRSNGTVSRKYMTHL